MSVNDGGFSDIGASIIRTVTPLIVGLILGVLGSDLAGITQEALTASVATVLSALYYVAARFLEQKWPKLGVLLGWARKPTYN